MVSDALTFIYCHLHLLCPNLDIYIGHEFDLFLKIKLSKDLSIIQYTMKDI